jgi:L-ascorbate metabolism protein UlaG (beta-lactamase superfamily)
VAEISVTLSANAGIALRFGSRNIWVDALHSQKQAGFSAVRDSLYRQIIEEAKLGAPDYICVTHCHPDHYCKDMLLQVKEMWPNATICMPEREVDSQILVTGDSQNVGDGIEFIRLPHEGAQYAQVKHYGILIHWAGKHILIAGDCETASGVLAHAIGDRPIDLAILNFPWITLAKGRNFLTQVMKPKNVLVCHLPFSEDDVNGFRLSAQRNAQQLNFADIRLLQEPLQTEVINI